MAVGRQTYKDKKTGEIKKVGKWYAKFKDHLGIKRKLPGFAITKPADEKKSSMAYKLTCEMDRVIGRLVNLRRGNRPPDQTSTDWLALQPDKLRDKLVEFGILDSTWAAAGKPLKEHLEDFRQSLLATSAKKQANLVLSRASSVFVGCKVKTWTDIEPNKVERYIAGLRKDSPGKEDVSESTYNYYLKAAKAFCRFMVKSRRAPHNPLDCLSYIKNPIEEHGRRALSENEIRRLLEAALSGPTRYGMTGFLRYALYRLLLETGLRRGEAKSLTVSSFDLKARTVTVLAAHSRKTKERTVQPLRKGTIPVYEELLRGKMPAVKVFRIPNRSAEMLRADLADTAVKDGKGNIIIEAIPYIDENGDYADMHSLRHCFVSHMKAAERAKQQAARHHSVRMTARYDHSGIDEVRAAIDTLPDFSLPSQTKQAITATGTDDLSSNLHPMSRHDITPIDRAKNQGKITSPKTLITTSQQGPKTGGSGRKGRLPDI
jgi:integrase